MILFITLIVHYAVLFGGLIILQQVTDEKMIAVSNAMTLLIGGWWKHGSS